MDKVAADDYEIPEYSGVGSNIQAFPAVLVHWRVSRKYWLGEYAQTYHYNQSREERIVRMKMLGNIFSTMANLLVQVIRGKG